MSEDLSTLTDRELSILILQEVRSVHATLEGLAQSVGRDVVGVANAVGQLRIDLTRDIGKVGANIDAARHELQQLGGVVRGTDYLAHSRVEKLEARVDALERRPRVVNGGE